MHIWIQRRRRHFNSGQATANKSICAPAKERERLYEKRVHAGQRRVCVDTWTNRLVLRLSLQSGSDPLKSGPAKAGPAGPATPPLGYIIMFYK